jgi:hypothetical protein
MLVSVDADKGTVTIYDSTVMTVPFNQIHKLKPLLIGKTVSYISEVELVSGRDIIDMVEDIAASGEYVSEPDEDAGDGRLWLRATGSGQMCVPLDGKRKLLFEHRGDFISLDKYGYDLSDRYPVVKSLLKKGKLELCNTVRMNKIKRIEAERQALREEQSLGSLIVDTSVRGKDPKVLAAKRRGLGPDDTIDMDDHSSPPSKTDGLDEDQLRVLQEGWGKTEAAANEEGEEDDGAEGEDGR